MAHPVSSKRERDQETKGDARPVGELREANRHTHEVLDLLGHELRTQPALPANNLGRFQLCG